MWKKIKDFLKKLFEVLITPAPPVEKPPENEYIYRAGDTVSIPVSTSGKIVGDFYVPDEGRINEAWVRGNFFGIFDSVGNCYEVRAFKIKACAVETGCHEPRYNLKWSMYRRITATWTPTEFVVDISGTVVKASRLTNWNPPLVLRYGDDGHLLAGAKNKNVTITSGDQK